MITPSNDRLRDLGREFPEWRPWLTIVDEVLREATDSKWEAFVPQSLSLSESKAPLLTGAKPVLEIAAVADWSERLMQTACRSGTPKMSTLDGATPARLNSAELFKLSLCQNGKRLNETAVFLGVDPDAFQAVAALVPVPFLQASNRRWQQSISERWAEGYCPVCGAWPAFAEVRGIERSRYLRCGRCGAGWQCHCLSCPHCGMTNHEQLVSLVPEKSGTNGVIDACKRCLGYVKTFTTLQGSAPDQVMLDDLASVALDIAALEQGYRRPEGAGYSLDIEILDKPSSSETVFSWRT